MNHTATRRPSLPVFITAGLTALLLPLIAIAMVLTGGSTENTTTASVSTGDQPPVCAAFCDEPAMATATATAFAQPAAPVPAYPDPAAGAPAPAYPSFSTAPAELPLNAPPPAPAPGPAWQLPL